MVIPGELQHRLVVTDLVKKKVKMRWCERKYLKEGRFGS